MRFPVVLFDLDGTVVDSGGIILASMRYATRTVLGRDIPDEALMAAVGGPGLEHQMRSFGPEHVEELIRVYREHNEPLHEELRGFLGMDDLLVALKEQGRKLGIVPQIEKNHSSSLPQWFADRLAWPELAALPCV